MNEFSKLGVAVVPYNKFALPGTEFLLYPGKSGKLQRRIERDGGTVEDVVKPVRASAGPSAHPVRRIARALTCCGHSVYFWETRRP